MAEILEAQDKAAGKQLSSSSSGQLQQSSSTQPGAPYVSPCAAASTAPGQPQQPQPNGQLPGSSPQQPQQQPTWVHDIFQGWLVSETRCLQCETITRREESFMDLSLEIDHNTSLTSCLKQFRCGAGVQAGVWAQQLQWFHRYLGSSMLCCKQ
jgi:hypothetical protein